MRPNLVGVAARRVGRLKCRHRDRQRRHAAPALGLGRGEVGDARRWPRTAPLRLQEPRQPGDRFVQPPAGLRECRGGRSRACSFGEPAPAECFGMLAGPVETACRTANKMHAFGDKEDAREQRVETCLRSRAGILRSRRTRGSLCPTPVALGGASDAVIMTPSSRGRQRRSRFGRPRRRQQRVRSWLTLAVFGSSDPIAIWRKPCHQWVREFRGQSRECRRHSHARLIDKAGVWTGTCCP